MVRSGRGHASSAPLILHARRAADQRVRTSHARLPCRVAGRATAAGANANASASPRTSQLSTSNSASASL